ncbi:hypothetical protein DERF_012224 [Dermatophagoides farinae]|uniref:Uncharacterized protein n=1 Tax=Dermatophagoides farinae TaxID=6954 RepID=A0A922HTM9_DERFA|nr:hypothetical protein DERF_012224 [Dermatophagoides farinae]
MIQSKANCNFDSIRFDCKHPPMYVECEYFFLYAIAAEQSKWNGILCDVGVYLRVYQHFWNVNANVQIL